VPNLLGRGFLAVDKGILLFWFEVNQSSASGEAIFVRVGRHIAQRITPEPSKITGSVIILYATIHSGFKPNGSLY
jgi:hypothetical protein